MKITLITMGNKMPDWVTSAVQEYCKRLKDLVTLTLVEIPLIKRGKSTDLSRVLNKEMLLMQAVIPEHAYLIAMDSKGESFTSEQLATKLTHLQLITPHICFLIGGPEGLASELVAISQEKWSLSSLTLPHTLARITLLETVYRAYTIINNHPYHK